jgi:hypothetical protein
VCDAQVLHRVVKVGGLSYHGRRTPAHLFSKPTQLRACEKREFRDHYARERSINCGDALSE